MKALLISVFAVFCLNAQAEEKTCAVEGMDCEGCETTIKAKACKGDMYSVCDVKVKDKVKKVGEIHVITKDPNAKVDEKALGAAIADTTYKVGKCSTKPAKKAAKAS